MIRLKDILQESTTPNFSAGIQSLKAEIRSSMQENGQDEDRINRVMAYINVLVPIAEKYYVSEFRSKAPSVPPGENPTPEQIEKMKTAVRSWIRKTVTDIAPSISSSDKWKLWLAFKAANWDTIKNIVTKVAWKIEGFIDNYDIDSNASNWSAMFEDFIVDKSFIEEMYNILVD